ncbi:inactive tyrosine-protein kinase PRAG1 [Corvus hawaiiensis]|uniref:inactive tyrosine-protein kinase PRAG1 n=1 Tax=Corvus hawaiiensis TaxID=134902 RepID=UPI002019F774|nr:inactive tyrosine-protein kinase PRAG1 [Corvus hawaiiensis]XP_048160418.1 inactive tyrosine-protein kinase PRAG1 [Corvus hawaiiensis]
MQNEQWRAVQKTQWALSLTHEDLKMSACSDFVEHIWKPGSCKNCFNPKSSHRLQTPPDVGACGVLPDGARTKPESLVLEDEGVNTSPFSKPTIAVKPTMINSDVSDAWADVNMNADLSQVSWGVISGKQLLLKSGDAQRICPDNFGNGGVRKPFLHNQPSDCLSCCPPSYSMVGLRSLEGRVDRNVSIHSLVLVGEVGKQEDRVKDKFALPHQVPCPNPSALGDRSTTNSSRNPSSQAREGAVLPSGGDCGHISSIFESEGGEYCSITNCHKEHPVPWELCCTEEKAAQCEKESHTPSGWRQRDAPETPRPSGRTVKFSEEERRAVNVAFCITTDQSDPLSYALCSDRKNLALHTEPASLPESTGSSKVAALALSREDEDLPLPGEPSVTGGPRTEGSSTPQQALVEPQRPRLSEPARGDPIYAESTKRRKAQLKAVGSQAKAEKLARGTAKEKADGLWKDGGWALGGEKEYQDSTGQVAAKITIMTAHTEDDHKTIFLSSPDSAVGVQWPCMSPTSHPDFGTSSPAIEAGQIFQASGSENSTRFHLAAPVKTSLTESPAIPPKMSKNSQPGSEGSRVPPVSSHVGMFGDDNSHDGAGAQLLPRSCTDTGAFGASPSPCAHVNGVSVEESSRGSSYDRRQKYYNPTWTKQCRIEEEEEQEEEQEVLNHPWTVGAESGRAGADFVDDGPILESQAGITKSSSFSFDFPNDKSNAMEFAPPPPPPPKKQSRHALKMNPNNTELERVSNSSAESLSPPFRSAHVTFTAGSSDSLDSDTQTGSDGRHSSEPNHSPPPAGSQLFPPVPFLPVSTEDGPSSAPSCPPPLPQKKTVIRTVSSPDGFFGGQASSGKAASAAIPRLNVSHSESNVCLREEPPFIHPASLGGRPGAFSSSESLEKSSKGNSYWGSSTGKSTGACGPGRNLQSLSSSQLSVSSQVSSASSLHNLLSNIDSKEGVYSKLGALYAESLRRLVAKCEDCFMREQKNELHFSENNWSLFKLTCNKPCCDSGDAIYYCATCSKDPSTTYAVKICKTQESKVAASYCSPAVPVHFNIQQDCGHFVASVPSSMLLASDVGKSMPGDGFHPSRAASEHDCVVVITREVPSQTTADFVRDSVTLHQAKPELYERRVCFLLLQLCNGLEHLKEHGIIHRDLCLENLLLVPCKPPMSCVKAKDDKHLPRLIISNFLKAKQKTGTGDSKLKKSQARLAPEIVSASQYKKFDEFQTGILIYELLHQPNPFEEKVHLREQEYSPEDLPALPSLSIYSRGLQQLAHLLLEADPIKRVRITEAKRMLQCLLWGPRKDLMEQPLSQEETLRQVLQNWVDMKRALLMMKFAERAVDTERSVELEDWLCCQYLASAEPASLLYTLRLLQLL